MLRGLFDKFLALASPGFSRELRSRNASRTGGSSQWFTRQEAVVALALARIIVPDGDGSPGIDSISPDQGAVTLLDGMMVGDSHRQLLYSYGLLAFDRWALIECGSGFADLSTEDQIRIFRMAQERRNCYSAGVSSLAKMRRAFDALIYARKGIFYADKLCPIIRNDCLEIFYTSQASWTWLQYDGPPMEKGYPSVTRPR